MVNASEGLGGGVDWHLNYHALDRLSMIVGRNVLEPVAEKRIVESKEWRVSEGKKRMETIMRGFLTMSGY